MYSDASNLEKFFDEQLEKWLPEYAYEMFEDEDDAPPAKKNRQYWLRVVGISRIRFSMVIMSGEFRIFLIMSRAYLYCNIIYYV